MVFATTILGILFPWYRKFPLAHRDHSQTSINISNTNVTMKTSHLVILLISCLVVLKVADAVPIQTHDQCLGFCNSARGKACGGLGEEESSSCIREFTSTCMKACLTDKVSPAALTAGTNSLDCTCTNGRTVSFCIKTCPPTDSMLTTVCTPICKVFGGLDTATCTSSTSCKV
mmetsp:Transcript_12519/g.17350  ORF Transcript_12519/g.17350 Transcript_12519/m.17350 type:complete len:173 (+) Transcript_12519:938-1456(+)